MAAALLSQARFRVGLQIPIRGVLQPHPLTWVATLRRDLVIPTGGAR